MGIRFSKPGETDEQILDIVGTKKKKGWYEMFTSEKDPLEGIPLQFKRTKNDKLFALQTVYNIFNIERGGTPTKVKKVTEILIREVTNYGKDFIKKLKNGKELKIQLGIITDQVFNTIDELSDFNNAMKTINIRQVIEENKRKQQVIKKEDIEKDIEDTVNISLFNTAATELIVDTFFKNLKSSLNGSLIIKSNNTNKSLTIPTNELEKVVFRQGGLYESSITTDFTFEENNLEIFTEPKPGDDRAEKENYFTLQFKESLQKAGKKRKLRTRRVRKSKKSKKSKQLRRSRKRQTPKR